VAFDKVDCHANALADEPMFILLARDPQFYPLVMAWSRRRRDQIRCGERPEADLPLVYEAEACAINGAGWRKENDGRWRLPKAPAEDGDWRDDPAADERWNAGLDFAMKQLCAALGVDPEQVTWDAATETVDGDVNAVIWNILRTRFGDNWDPNATHPRAVAG
jgi:hypothetical protein